MEPVVRSTPAPPPLPVAWLEGDVLAEYLAFLDELEEAAAPGLQGDVLAEYLRFLELNDEEATPAPAPRPMRVPPVAWLQGEVRDEFLRFLEESNAGGAAAVACPEMQQEVRGLAPHASDDDVVGLDGHGDGVVVDDDDYYDSFVDDDYESFVDDDDEEDDDDVCVMEYRSEDGGVVFTMDTDEDEDPVLELLRPHILDIPAFRERAAGLVPPQPPLAFPRPQGGWMSSVSDDEFPRQEGRMRSELLRRRIQDLRARYRACAAEVEAVQQRLSRLFPRRQDGCMSSDNNDEMTDEFPRQDDGWMVVSDDADNADEMTDEFPRQDDGWMGSDEEEMTDEFTGNRNRFQLRRTY